MQATGWIKRHQNLKDMYNIEHSVVHPFYNVTFNGKAPNMEKKPESSLRMSGQHLSWAQL